MRPVVTARPVILLDVDGVLNPFRAAWHASDSPEMAAAGFRTVCGDFDGRSVPLSLARWHGQWLNRLRLSADIVWATGWNHRANTQVGPQIDLPHLEVLDLVYDSPGSRLHWKSEQVADYLATQRPGAPWVWIDDETVDGDRDYVNAHPGTGDGWMLFSDPATGLTEDDFERLLHWVSEHT